MPAMRFIHPLLTLQLVEAELVVALSPGSKTSELKASKLKASKLKTCELKTCELKARELKTCELKTCELKAGAGWKPKWLQF